MPNQMAVQHAADAPFERQQFMRAGEFANQGMPQQGWGMQPQGAQGQHIAQGAQGMQQAGPRPAFANPTAAEEAAQGIIPGKDTLTIIPTDAPEGE